MQIRIDLPKQVSLNHTKYDCYLKEEDWVFTSSSSTPNDICIMVNINLDKDGYLFFQVIYMATGTILTRSSHKTMVALFGLKKTIETAVWGN